jgi:uncharacterized small protein (DUF1192 family)
MKLTVGVLATLIVLGCGGPEPKTRSVDDLAEDPAVLQGLLARCDADKVAKHTDVECANARRAQDRRGVAEDERINREREAESERLRAQRRQQDDARERAAAKANPAFDPYSSPVTTDAPAGSPKP